MLLFLVATMSCFAQKEKWSHGLSYGCGRSYIERDDYFHDNYYLRGHFYYTPKQHQDSFQLQLAIEPEINDARHRDFNAKRIQMYEYSVTFGGIARQYIGSKWSVYAFLGTGPVYLDMATKREPRGMAVTNTLALGTSYRFKNMWIELRPNLRHISNADTRNPNRGIDTANLELGIFFPFK